MRIHTQKGREWKVLGDHRGLGEKGMISDRGNLNEMQRYSKWSLGDLCIVCVFSLRSHFWHFFLSSHALSPSVIHTPCGHAPLFTPSYTHLCNWNANEARGVWARSSATVWLQRISAKKSPKCHSNSLRVGGIIIILITENRADL